MDYFVLTHQASTRHTWLRSHWPCQGPQNPLERAIFEGFLKSQRGRLLTTAGVIAEIQGHIRRAQKESKASTLAGLGSLIAFWDMVRDVFVDLRIREETPSLVELERETLIALGPVDASLVKLTQAFQGPSRRVLLTNDNALRLHCRTMEIPAQLVPTWIHTLSLDR